VRDGVAEETLGGGRASALEQQGPERDRGLRRRAERPSPDQCANDIAQQAFGGRVPSGADEVARPLCPLHVLRHVFRQRRACRNPQWLRTIDGTRLVNEGNTSGAGGWRVRPDGEQHVRARAAAGRVHERRPRHLHRY
jgi:hypothetical protein